MPITLLNVIYKIWAIITTSRIASIIYLLANDLQLGYKNRSTNDIVKYIKQESYLKPRKQYIYSGIVKAFDKINRDALW